MPATDHIFDTFLSGETWSDLSQREGPPEIDFVRIHGYRLDRLREALERHDAAMCMLVNPISLRYAVDYRTYLLFQSHIPSTCLFLAREGPTVIYNAFESVAGVDESRSGRSISFFDAAGEIPEQARPQT